jgi:hypothetical protein
MWRSVSIIADLGFATGAFTASAELVANNAGLPGSTLVTGFTMPSIAATASIDVIFAPTSSVTLTANNDYWFILSASGSGSYQWEYTNTLSSSFPNYAANDGTGFTIGTPAGPFLIGIRSPSSVPEPSSFALAGLLGLGVVLSSRLRSRR